MVAPESTEKTEAAECPRWNQCNASLCPLLNWRKAHHRSSEPICKYLTDSQKTGASERYADDPAFHECVKEFPAIAEKYPSIGKQVEKSGKSKFRGQHLMKAALESHQ